MKPALFLRGPSGSSNAGSFSIQAYAARGLARAQRAIQNGLTPARPGISPARKPQGADMSTRTPQEIFQHHAETLIAGDLEGIVSDYADDAVILSPGGVKKGKAGVRETFVNLLADLPKADWEVPTVLFEGDILFLEWKAKAEKTYADDGVDTFLFQDGKIKAQTVRYTLKKV